MAGVRGFGAKGDGKTDDTAALQHALDKGDGILELENATYRITRPLLLDLSRRGRAAAMGQGGTSRIVMAGAGPAIRVRGDHRGTADPKDITPHTWQSERFPVLQGFEIVGEHPQAVGIELRGTLQATLSHLLVRRCKYGVHLVERNRNFLMSACHLYDNWHFGLFIDRCNLHQAIVQGNHISYSRRAGIKTLDGDVHNLQITGNDIEYNRPRGEEVKRLAGKDEETPLSPADGGGRAADVWFEAPHGIISEVTLSGNTIQATATPAGANVRIEGPEKDAPRGARLITITGNVIGAQERGIELRRAQRVVISGNTIYDSHQLSIDAGDCSALSINANTFIWRVLEGEPPRDGILLEDCENAVLSGLVSERLGYGTPEHGGGITLVRCRDVTVSGCHLLDPLVRGIELVDCTRCRVAGNTVLDRRVKPTMREAIRLRGTGRDNSVSGNMVGGAVQQAIIAAESSAEVRDNFHVLP